MWHQAPGQAQITEKQQKIGNGSRKSKIQKQLTAIILLRGRIFSLSFTEADFGELKTSLWNEFIVTPIKILDVSKKWKINFMLIVLFMQVWAGAGVYFMEFLGDNGLV